MGRFTSNKKYKTKRYTRDADQILHDDLSSKERIESLKHQKFDEYLPGLGQHYCVPCAKYFETDIALGSHERSKVHKRQLKDLRFMPYTQEEAAAAGGRDIEKYMKKQEEQRAIHALEPTKNQLTVKKPEPPVAEQADMETDNLLDAKDKQSTELAKDEAISV